MIFKMEKNREKQIERQRETRADPLFNFFFFTVTSKPLIPFLCYIMLMKKKDRDLYQTICNEYFTEENLISKKTYIQMKVK